MTLVEGAVDGGSVRVAHQGVEATSSRCKLVRIAVNMTSAVGNNVAAVVRPRLRHAWRGCPTTLRCPTSALGRGGDSWRTMRGCSTSRVRSPLRHRIGEGLVVGFVTNVNEAALFGFLALFLAVSAAEILESDVHHRTWRQRWWH